MKARTDENNSYRRNVFNCYLNFSIRSFCNQLHSTNQINVFKPEAI